MRTLFFILSLVILFAFSSCDNSKKYAVELKQLDSLDLVLDSAELRIKTIDTTKIHNYIKELISNMDFIEKNNRDTISREMAFVLSDYSLLRDPMKKINKTYAENAEELERTQGQIGDLIHDIKIGKVDELKVATYLLEESIITNRVSKNIEVIADHSKTLIEKFEENNPKVLEFIERIKSKQGAPK